MLANQAPQAGRPRYVVITPARDEARYLPETIRSMVGQTVLPAQWIIVNDGSSDGTAAIADDCAAAHSWIQAVHLPDRSRAGGPSVTGAGRKRLSRGMRALQAKEIEAFYQGYERVTASWDFLVKLDADLGFPPDYFERCFEMFAADPQLGIGGGVICHQSPGGLRKETTPRFHVRGATKIYRRACWEQIGGVLRGAGWDTVDQIKANMLGWTTRSFDSLQVIHYRHTGAANGAWRNAVKNGVWSYVSGYHPLFMLLRCGRSLFEKPWLVGSAGLLYGFLLAGLQRVPQIEDRRAIRYLREQQLRRMSFRASVWR